VVAAIEIFAADAAPLLLDLTKPTVAGHYPDSHLVGRVLRWRQRPCPGWMEQVPGAA
jgi:hypothetical protein